MNTSLKKVNTALQAFFLEKGIPVLQETPIALEAELIYENLITIIYNK